MSSTSSQPIDRAQQRLAVDALRSVLPASCVLYQEEDTKSYECDGLTLYRQVPMVVVLPKTQSQVGQVLKICHERRIPVVPRGAGTGLSGSALPHAGGVLLSMAKFNRILALNAQARTATVQPGVRNLRSPRSPPRTGCITRPIHRPRSPARSAAMSRDFWRRALPQIRPDGAQRTACTGADDGWRGDRIRRTRTGCARP